MISDGKLNDLEIAILGEIAKQYPAARADLTRHFRSVTVERRENTGAGFFVHLIPDTERYPPVDLRSPLGDAHVQIDGMRYGIGSLVFLKDGYPRLLEGYSLAGEDTSTLDFSAIKFSILRDPSTP